MPAATKPGTAPARRRTRVKPLPPGPPNSKPMTLDVVLVMRPVYDLLAANGIEWEAIPEAEFAAVVGIWRRDRMSRGQWRVDWQPDGENFVLEYARSHRWFDPEVTERFAEQRRTRKPGDLTEAQMNSMTHEEWLEWEASTVT